MASHINLANEDNVTICNLLWSNTGDKLFISCDVGTIFILGNDSSQTYSSSWNFQKLVSELTQGAKDEVINQTTHEIVVDKTFVDDNLCP